MYESLHSLPKYIGAKMFILLDKMSSMVTMLSACITIGMDQVLTKFPASELESALKSDKAFKVWYRAMEDTIDELGQSTKERIIELSTIFGSASTQNSEVKDFMKKQLSNLIMDLPSMQHKRTAERLVDLSRIIESSNILDDLEISRINTKTTRTQTGIDDDFAHPSQLRSGGPKNPGHKGLEEPTREFSAESPSRSEFGQTSPIKNVRISKGVITCSSKSSVMQTISTTSC